MQDYSIWIRNVVLNLSCVFVVTRTAMFEPSLQTFVRRLYEWRWGLDRRSRLFRLLCWTLWGALDKEFYAIYWLGGVHSVVHGAIKFTAERYNSQYGTYFVSTKSLLNCTLPVGIKNSSGVKRSKSRGRTRFKQRWLFLGSLAPSHRGVRPTINESNCGHSFERKVFSRVPCVSSKRRWGSIRKNLSRFPLPCLAC